MFFECHDILVRFARATVLDVKHLAVPAGKITAVVGPNGAGKTTLLEVMALLRRPARGSVSLWGRDARVGNRDLQRKVVMVMHPGYMFRGSVLDNLAYGPRARGVSRKQARDRANGALKMVGMSDFAQRSAADLSAGERQRVNLARAVAAGAQALLLDEPAANVDSQTVEAIAGLLMRLRDEQGITIVHTSPADNQFHGITDHAVELADGRVVATH